MRVILRAFALVALVSGAVAQQASGVSPLNPKINALCGGDPALAVMSSDLLQARLDVVAGRSALASAQAHMPQAVRGNKIQVVIGVRDVSDDVLAAIDAAGLEVVNTLDQGDYHAITVRCTDPRQLDALARLPGTRGIASEPARTTCAGAVTSQGDSSHRASNARVNYTLTGAPYRVGVLSDSIFDTRGGVPPGVYPGNHTGSLDQVSGDLPASVWVVDPGPGGGSDEGNGMAQLIWDLAPGCDISFASAYSGYLAFAANIASLESDATAPADVLVDDVYYYVEPMYQNGPIAIAANNAVAAGVPYFSSAGNFANQAHERNYVDVVPALDDTAFPVLTGNDLHDFGVASGGASDAYLNLSLPSGGQVAAVLHWDEPYGGIFGVGPGSTADLDLYLVNSLAPPSPANIVGSSTWVQGTPGSPFGDSWEYLIDTVGPGTYYLCIDHFQGRDDTAVPPLLLHLLVDLSGTGAVIPAPDSAYLGDRTMYGHNSAQNVQAVAAMFYPEEQTGGNFTAPPAPQLDVESFSSLGGWAPSGLPFYFSDDGNTRTDPPPRRNKPELTGIDGTDTTFFGSADFEPNGFLNFWGTSAAAPHVAAVAALMLDRADDFGLSPSPATIYNAMQLTARDAETVGLDSLSGYGLVDANAACGHSSIPVELSIFGTE